MANPIIEIKNLVYNITNDDAITKVLGGITLQINAGEKIAIIGPSGSGKTSLMMLIAGLASATSGSIRIMQQNLEQMGEDELAQFRLQHLGIIFQDFHLIPSMTLSGNITLPLSIAKRECSNEVLELNLDAVGLKHRANHYPWQLSGGEQQRAAIARAAIMQPSIILADEPTGNLDSVNSNKIFKHLFALNEKGSTLVMITHNNEIAQLCDKTIRIVDGEIAA